MAKKFINNTRVEGLLYQHDLTLKTSGEKAKNPGVEYITGKIEIATDDAGINIVPVHFTYVTATTSKGKTNDTFVVLKNIINGTYKSVMSDGTDNAVKLRIDSAIGLNEFYTERNGKEEFVSAKRNDGGFVHVTNAIDADEKKRNTFTCDMIITGVSVKEADEERNLPEKAIIKGAIFDFRNNLLPVEFSAINPNAISYFLGLEVSSKNPFFTKVWGRQVSEITTRKIVEESAFGEPSVREVQNSNKDFVITGAASDPYEWDSEDSITAAELKEAMAARETTIATIKQRYDEYNATKGNAIPASASTDEFKF